MLHPKQFIRQIGARRAAVKHLSSAAGWSGAHNAYGAGSPSFRDRQGDPFGNNAGGPFSAPNHQDRLDAATSNARKVGLSDRKINKVVNKSRDIGHNFGVNEARKTSPFQ